MIPGRVTLTIIL